jgi:hypothetical protein
MEIKSNMYHCRGEARLARTSKAYPTHVFQLLRQVSQGDFSI